MHLKYSVRLAKGRILAVISLMLLSSAIARATTINRESSPIKELETQLFGPLDVEKCYQEADIAEILSDIEKNKSEIENQQQMISKKETKLIELKASIEKKILELKSEETALRKTLNLATTAAEADVEALTSLYSQMKPKEAAKIFEAMPVEFAAGFISRLPPESSAQIMAGLAPEHAYSITAFLAGRNHSASLALKKAEH